RALLPCAPAVSAGKKFSGGAGRAIAVAEEDAAAIRTRHHSARVLPRRIELLVLPAQAIVLARVQAAIGRRQHPVFGHRDAVHVGGYEAGIRALPVPAAVVAAQDAADLDGRPYGVAREQELRDARRAAVDVGKFGDTRDLELAPARAAI